MKKRDGILRLKYRLEPKENDMVEFQILEQDIELYGKNREYIHHGVYNKWRISSDCMPEITNDWCRTILLRGSARLQNNTISKFQGHHLIPSIHKALELFIKSKYGNCKVVKG
jgi:hypothetical protein